MPALALKPVLRTIDLSAELGIKEAKVVSVPFPKNTIGIIFGQRTAAWLQRYNTYLCDTNHDFITDPQAVWDAESDNSRFLISAIKPQDFAPNASPVLSVGPYDEDQYIVVFCSHKKDGDTSYEGSDPQHNSNEFKIGNKNAITFTMINAEDGGDSDHHDTVVGVAVVYTTK